MKKIILLTACLFTLNTVTKAQDAQPASTKTAKAPHTVETPEVRAQNQVDKMNAEAALTADQKTKVYQLFLTKAKTMDDIKAKYKGKPEMRETAKKEMETAKIQCREALKTVLTPDQIAKLKAAKKAKQGK